MTDKWRDACKKMQSEGIKFELFSDNSQEWREAKCYFDSYDLSHYQIARQPIPEQIENYLQEEQMNKQEEVIMMDGEPLEVGDTVYCLIHGNGVVFESHVNKEKVFPICIQFGKFKDTYTENFKHQRNSMRSLFWQKPEITPPPKPKKKVKVWDWFVQWPNGDVNRMDMLTEQDARHGTVAVQKIDGTEREIEQ